MIKILSKSARGLALVGSITASTILGSGVVSARGYHGNDYGSNSSRYSTRLDELNGSGVTGRAKVTLEDEAISVTLNATGLVPGKVHPAHIHGQLTGPDLFRS